VFESRVTWATFVPILVFLGLSVLDLGPMYATDVRETDVRHHHRLMSSLLGQGHKKSSFDKLQLLRCRSSAWCFYTLPGQLILLLRASVFPVYSSGYNCTLGRVLTGKGLPKNRYGLPV